MNVNINTSGLWFRSLASGGLKSTQQKMERQAECENKITFFENPGSFRFPATSSARSSMVAFEMLKPQ